MNLLTVLAAAIVAGAANFLSDAEWAAHDALTVIAVPLFVAAGMYREYHRTTAFSRHDMAMLLWVDGPYLAVTGGCLVAMMVWPQRFADLAAAFLAMSAGCVVSQFCVRARGGDAARRLFHGGWIATYRRISGEVAWSLAGVFANHVQSRSYVYIATSLAGIASLATINAVGVLFRPVSVLVNAWGQSALPHLAAALANGRIDEFDRMLARALAAAAVASVAWGGLLWLAWEPIEHYLLAGKYSHGAVLVLPWAAASGASVLRYIGSMALNAAREFRFLAITQALCGGLAAAATAGFHPVARLCRRDVGHRHRQWGVSGVGDVTAAACAPAGREPRAGRCRPDLTRAIDDEGESDAAAGATGQGCDPQPRLPAPLPGAVL